MTSAKSFDDPYWTTLGYFRPVFESLRAQGQDLTPALQVLGLTESDLSSADIRIPNRLIDELFAVLERQCGDPAIGLHMGQQMQMQHVGILGLLILSCRTLREVFELHSRYQTLVGNGLATIYERCGDEIFMRSMAPPGHPPMGRHGYDYSLVAWAQLVTQVLGQRYRPTRAELPYSRPSDDAELRALLGDAICYDAAVLQVVLPAEYAEQELLAADPQLKSLLEMQASKRLQELQTEQSDQDPQVQAIRRLIADRLAFGAPALEEIARELGTSVRTLQRHLDNRGSSFKQLLDDVRCDLARQYIANEELSLLEVAMMLGFAEQSSFARAFKRWFQAAPGSYRQQVLSTA